MMNLSVIINNWNDRDNLARCLQSLDRCAVGLTKEIIVIDNASMDGSVAMVEAKFPGVTLIRNTINRGAVARNQGLALAKGKWVLFLDSDTEIRLGSLEALLAAAETDQRIGLCGPKLLYSNGETQYSARTFPTISTFVLRGLGWGNQTKKMKQHLMISTAQTGELSDVDWLLGACQLVRKSMIDQIGRLGKNYFLYYGDVEYCWRAKRFGWRVVYAPAVTVFHHYQRRSAKGGWFNPLRWSHAKSALRFFAKRYWYEVGDYLKSLFKSNAGAKSLT